MIKSLLIGCGNIGFDYDSMSPQYNQTHFRALFSDKRFSLVSAIDKNLDKQSKIKNEFGVDCVESLSQVGSGILNDVELVVISTSEGKKIEILGQISEFGLSPKVVLYEKPIATTVNELNLFMECFQTISSEIRFNFMRRANPSYQWLKNNFQNIIGRGSTLYLQINFTGNLHNSLSHGIDFLIGLLGIAKFQGVQISMIDNIWVIKNEYVYLVINRLEVDVSILEVNIMSENAKIHYSNTDEVLTISEVGSWYDFKGNFYTKNTRRFDFSAINYMSYTYDEVFKLINNGVCALTNIHEALLTFELIEKLRGDYVETCN